MGNSMGGLISLLEAEAAPSSVAGLVLVDPAIPGPLSQRPDAQVLVGFAVSSVPGVAERLLARRRRRLGAEGQVKATLNLCTVDRSRVDPETVRLTVEQAESRSGDRDGLAAFIEASRSVVTTSAGAARCCAPWRRCRVPVLLLHGEARPSGPVAAARQAAAAYPAWTYVELADNGHVPQMETPAVTAADRPATGSTAPGDRLRRRAARA